MEKLSTEDQGKLIQLLEWRIAVETENMEKLPGVKEFREMVEQYKRILAILCEIFKEQE